MALPLDFIHQLGRQNTIRFCDRSIVDHFKIRDFFNKDLLTTTATLTAVAAAALILVVDAKLTNDVRSF